MALRFAGEAGTHLNLVPVSAAPCAPMAYVRPMTGWVEYIIASDDPADRALLDEFRNQAWAYGELMRFITADPENINEETFASLEATQEADNDLQARIHARGEALRDAGHAPADEAAFKAWRATWVPLASHLPTQDGDMPSA